MRIIVFFDLPVETAAERRNYTRFRKFLIKNGYMMLQKSVYCKLALNMTAANASIEAVRRSKPTKGHVALLVVTEKQYSRMEIIVGEISSDIVNSDERLVVL